MDGKLVGTTPMALPSVPAGSHAIRLEHDGYRRWSSSVRVVASEQKSVRAPLKKKKQKPKKPKKESKKNFLGSPGKKEKKKMEAILALEDGTWFRGAAAGAEGEARGEVVFNTSMTGYQEVLTDPSYSGQIVTMTCPEIGNYGVSTEDVESRAPQVAGFIIRDESPVASNWRSEMTLRDYLVANNIVAISDIDTRALTRQLRSGGVMRGVIATGSQLDPQALVERARTIPPMEGSDLVRGVTPAEAFDWPEEDPDEFGVTPDRLPKRRLKIAAYDFGMKWNILRRLSAHGCDVRVYPATTPASELLATKPGRRLPEQRPRRSGAADLRDRQREGAGRVRTCRCSASASATRFSASPWAAPPSS